MRSFKLFYDLNRCSWSTNNTNIYNHGKIIHIYTYVYPFLTASIMEMVITQDYLINQEYLLRQFGNKWHIFLSVCYFSLNISIFSQKVKLHPKESNWFFYKPYLVFDCCIKWEFIKTMLIFIKYFDTSPGSEKSS